MSSQKISNISLKQNHDDSLDEYVFDFMKYIDIKDPKNIEKYGIYALPNLNNIVDRQEKIDKIRQEFTKNKIAIQILKYYNTILYQEYTNLRK